MKEFHILNLGAGVQSTALYLMSARKEFNIPWFDAAIFADTGEEPRDVYEHLNWLEDQGGPTILRRSTENRLGDDLKVGGSRRSRGKVGMASIPAFTLGGDGRIGKVTRQCTKEYKTEVVEKCIRHDIFGMQKGDRIAGRYFAHQYIGMSAEESRRVRNTLAVFQIRAKWSKAHFPLWAMNWHRQIVKDYLRRIVPHEVPRSACTFCPFHDNAEWQRLKKSPADWNRACEIDDALRGDALAARNIKGKMFVHRSCVPLRDADLTTDRSETHELALSGVWATDCTGFCGH